MNVTLCHANNTLLFTRLLTPLNFSLQFVLLFELFFMKKINFKILESKILEILRKNLKFQNKFSDS